MRSSSCEWLEMVGCNWSAAHPPQQLTTQPPFMNALDDPLSAGGPDPHPHDEFPEPEEPPAKRRAMRREGSASALGLRSVGAPAAPAAMSRAPPSPEDEAPLVV